MGVRTSFWEKRTLSVIGPRPVSKSSVAALTRDRLSHVDQNYVRPETIRAANHRLIEAQGQIALAAQWGGGLVASADGLRFVVPVATLNARPNPLVKLDACPRQGSG
jgi:TnpA family transposase